MFRAAASRVVTRTSVSSATVSAVSPAATATASFLYNNNMISAIDGPMYIPGCDFLGRPIKEEDTSASTTVPSEEPRPHQVDTCTHTFAHTEIKPTGEVTKTTIVRTTTKTKLFASILNPQPGTNAYGLLHPTAQHPTTMPSFLQRVVFGTADCLLDRTILTKATMEMKKEDLRGGFFRSIYYGVPAQVLDAKIGSTECKATVKVATVKEIGGIGGSIAESKDSHHSGDVDGAVGITSGPVVSVKTLLSSKANSSV